MLREATGEKDARRFLPAAPAKNPMHTEPGPGALHGTTPMHTIRPFLHKKPRRATPGSLEKSFPTVLPTKPSILLRSLQYRSGVFESNQNCAKYGNRQGVARRGFLCKTALQRARLLARNHRRRSQASMTASTTCRREQHQQRQRECGLRYRRRGFWTRETQRS